jgi:hypothetical protein
MGFEYIAMLTLPLLSAVAITPVPFTPSKYAFNSISYSFFVLVIILSIQTVLIFYNYRHFLLLCKSTLILFEIDRIVKNSLSMKAGNERA